MMTSSLKSKLIFLFLFGIFLTLLVLLLILYFEFYKNEKQLHSHDANAVAENIKLKTERLFNLGLNPDELLGYETLLAKSIENSEALTFISLLDSQYRPLYSFGTFPPSIITQSPLTISPTLKDDHIVIKPVERINGQTTFIAVAIDHDKELQHVNDLIYKVLAYELVAFLFGAIAVLIFLKTQLIRPINDLISHINHASLTDAEQPNNKLVTRKDEIGHIALAFNSLMKRLRHSQRSYIDTNNKLLALTDELESRVNKRTKALSEANERLDELSKTDPLSRLGNRLHFNEAFIKHINHSKRHHHNFSILMIDLDNFKHTNDRYGHAAGDFVIKTIGQRLTNTFRGSDSAFRIGGDEFVLFLTEYSHHTDLASLAQKALHCICEPILYDCIQLPIGASIGVASIEKHASIDPETFLKLADQAMYTAKSEKKGIIFVEGEA